MWFVQGHGQKCIKNIQQRSLSGFITIAFYYLLSLGRAHYNGARNVSARTFPLLLLITLSTLWIKPNIIVSYSRWFTKIAKLTRIDLTKLSREQGWRSGESTRLPPMWPGFDSRSRRHRWVEFVVGSRSHSEGFSPGAPVFLPPQKPTFLNSNSTWKQWREEPLRGFH